MAASYDERPLKLAELEPSKRLETYIALMPRTHPPDLRLAEIVAKAGAAVVPGLKRHLKSENDVVVADISVVMWRMQVLGTYDVQNDKELRQLYTDRIAHLRIATVLPMLQQSAKYIGWIDLDGNNP